MLNEQRANSKRRPVPVLFAFAFANTKLAQAVTVDPIGGDFSGDTVYYHYLGTSGQLAPLLRLPRRGQPTEALLQLYVDAGAHLLETWQRMNVFNY